MLMPDTNYGNLSAAVITSAGATSSTSIEVASADGAILPAAPFFATIMATGSLANANNSEIVKVTAKSTSGGITTLTVTRAQRGTSAVSWSAGEAILANAIYTEDVLSQSQGYYQAVLSSGALFTITNASAPTSPVIGSRIRLTFDTTIPTAETVTLAINGGTAYQVDCHGATFATVGSVTNKVIIATNKVYTLEFDGTRWLMSNIASTILSSDITDGAITTSKIANAAVTSSKIDWTTLPKSIGTNSSYVKFGNLLIQWGQLRGLRSDANTTYTMPQSFANTNYTLVVSSQFDEGANSFWWAFICTKAVKSFAARGGFKGGDNPGGGFNADNICNWIAIGQAPSN